MDQISMAAQESMKRPFPGQVVLVLQGGGAVGAYQAGVYEALHDAAIEPDWVIGTSIGVAHAVIRSCSQFNYGQRLATIQTRSGRC